MSTHPIHKDHVVGNYFTVLGRIIHVEEQYGKPCRECEIERLTSGDSGRDAGYPWTCQVGGYSPTYKQAREFAVALEEALGSEAVNFKPFLSVRRIVNSAALEAVRAEP